MFTLLLRELVAFFGVREEMVEALGQLVAIAERDLVVAGGQLAVGLELGVFGGQGVDGREIGPERVAAAHGLLEKGRSWRLTAALRVRLTRSGP